MQKFDDVVNFDSFSKKNIFILMGKGVVIKYDQGWGGRVFSKEEKTSSPKAKMCGRFQTPRLIMAINFIPQLSYPRANCQHINCTAHKKRTVGLPLKSTTSSDINVCQGQL